MLEGSATYYGGYFDMMIQNYAMYSFESLRRAVLTDAPQFYGGDDVFTSQGNRADRVRTYTRAMHGTSMAAALAWPERVDLSGHRLMLDIGGGSGAHAIGAAQAGRQHSGRELSSMLEEAGFSDIEVTPAFGYYSIVIGRKPG